MTSPTRGTRPGLCARRPGQKSSCHEASHRPYLGEVVSAQHDSKPRQIPPFTAGSRRGRSEGVTIVCYMVPLDLRTPSVRM